ncbi:MAG: L-dopachrome tautomerase-related protein, partial [Verrucomicrobiota bacterium]
FPSVEMSRGEADQPGSFDSIMGVRKDSNGVVWFLDNGRRAEKIPKLVGWDLSERQIHQVIFLPAPVTTETSFLVDFAVHPDGSRVFIADPAAGLDAALIVVDLASGLGRRVLQGHPSVLAENIPFTVNGRKLRTKLPDGRVAEPLSAVNPITMDRKGRFLYFGAMKGRSLYRIPASLLRVRGVEEEEIIASLERYSDKPISDSITIDAKDNIYAGDLAKNAIAVIPPRSKRVETYLSDSKLSWPDGLTFGGDGKLYFFCSQVNRTDWYGGKNDIQPPFSVYRIKPLFQPLIPNAMERNPLEGIRERINPFHRD